MLNLGNFWAGVRSWWAHCVAYTSPFWQDVLRQRETIFEHSAAVVCLYSAHGKMLDVGTGSGRLPLLLAQLAPEITCIGVDLKPILFKKAQQLCIEQRCGERVSFMCADALALPFTDLSFDWAVCVASIHQWRDRKKGITEMYRVLKEGGVGVILVGTEIMQLFDFFRRNTGNDRDIEAAFQNAGFRDIRATHRNRFLQVIGRKVVT